MSGWAATLFVLLGASFAVWITRDVYWTDRVVYQIAGAAIGLGISWLFVYRGAFRVFGDN